MPRALAVCPRTGCANLTTGGACTTCRTEADTHRGTARQRGYGRQHERRFRPGVLRRDPLCTCTTTQHGHPAPCLAPSTVADHHPRTKRELRALRMDEHDPANGRGLCSSCHNKHTPTTSPGGWHQRHAQ